MKKSQQKQKQQNEDNELEKYIREMEISTRKILRDNNRKRLMEQYDSTNRNQQQTHSTKTLSSHIVKHKVPTKQCSKDDQPINPSSPKITQSTNSSGNSRSNWKNPKPKNKNENESNNPLHETLWNNPLSNTEKKVTSSTFGKQNDSCSSHPKLKCPVLTRDMKDNSGNKDRPMDNDTMRMRKSNDIKRIQKLIHHHMGGRRAITDIMRSSPNSSSFTSHHSNRHSSSEALKGDASLTTRCDENGFELSSLTLREKYRKYPRRDVSKKIDDKSITRSTNFHDIDVAPNVSKPGSEVSSGDGIEEQACHELQKHPILLVLEEKIRKENILTKKRFDKKLQSVNWKRTVHQLWMRDNESFTKNVIVYHEKNDSDKHIAFDIEAIKNGESQLQSVPYVRAKRKLFETNKLHEPTTTKICHLKNDIDMKNNHGQDLVDKDPPKRILSFEDKYQKPLKIKRLVACEKVILCNGEKNQERTLTIDQIENMNDTGDEKDGYPLWEIKTVCLSSTNEEEIWPVKVCQIGPFICETNENSKPKSQQIHDGNNVSLTVVHRQEFTQYLDGQSEAITSLIGVYRSNMSIYVTVFLKCGRIAQDDKVIMDEYDTKIDIPTFEILDRLKLKYLCGALDFNFWSRKDNEKMLWSPLLDHLELDTISKEEAITNSKITGKTYTLKARFDWENSNTGEQLYHIKNDEYSCEPICESRSLKDRDDLTKAYQFIQTLGYYSQGVMIEYDKLSSLTIKLEEKRTEIDTPSLSLRLIRQTQLPDSCTSFGVCDFGNKGVPWVKGFFEKDSNIYEIDNQSIDDPSYVDPTHLAMSLYKDEKTKWFPSTKVLMCLAFEKTIMVPKYDSWEDIQYEPSQSVGEPVDGNISHIIGPIGRILLEPLESLFDKRKYECISVVDPTSLDISDVQGCANPDHSVERITDIKRFGHDAYQRADFRKYVLAEPWEPDKSIPTHIFGITQNAISPNEPCPTSILTWKSKEYCIECLARKRFPKDYFYISRNKLANKHGGTVSPNVLLHIKMKGYKIDSIYQSSLDVYVKEQKQKERIEKEKILAETMERKIRNGKKLFYQQQEKNLIDIQKEEEHLQLKSIHYSNDTNRANMIKSFPPLSSKVDENDEQKLNNDDVDKNINEINVIDIENNSSFDLTRRHIVRVSYSTDSDDSCWVKPVNGVQTSGRIVGMVDPALKSVTEYTIDETMFQTSVDSICIRNIVMDRILLAEGQKKQQIIQETILNGTQEDALKCILKIPLTSSPAKELERTMEEEKTNDETNEIVNNNMDRDYDNTASYMNHKYDYHDDDNYHSDANNSFERQQQKQSMVQRDEYRALQAVKVADYNVLEEVLDDNGLNIETMDGFGNTLLIIACQQQGKSKKMVKFLLRRGANINASNHAGNTCLHYLYEYGHDELAKYLIRKGADDSLLNAEGFTCYEGTNANFLDDDDM